MSNRIGFVLFGFVVVFLGVGSAFLPVAMADCTTLFGDDVLYDADDFPLSVAIGDLNGDGHLDLAVANTGYGGGEGDSVSVLLNDGDGNFTADDDGPYGVGNTPVYLVIGDLDGDGDADLAVANYDDDTVSVLLNDGDGNFTADSDGPYGVGNEPMSVAIGYLNQDDHLDLAVANHGANTVSVLLNDGDGNFADEVHYIVGSHPVSVAMGDLDGDGDADLAVANYEDDTVSVLLNEGDGTFCRDLPICHHPAIDVGNAPESVAIDDLNGDGDADLAVANYLDNTVSVLLNNGNGTFEDWGLYDVGDHPFSVAIGDLDGDGDADLAVANTGYGGGEGDIVSVLLNDGDGIFTADGPYGAGDGAISVAIGDLNEDGAADLAVANGLGNSISVLLGQCLPDCNGNGIHDLIDIAEGTSQDCNTDAIPDECELFEANEIAQLLDTKGAANDQFGVAVAISGNVAIVGANLDDDGGMDQGSAFIYRFDGREWRLEDKLMEYGGRGAWFGFSVAISGNVAVVGAPFADHGDGSFGAAFVFRYCEDQRAWIEEDLLHVSDGPPGGIFGFSVAVSEDIVAVKADKEEGWVYIYRFDPDGPDGPEWPQEATLVPENAQSDDLGLSTTQSVGISGDVVVFGGPAVDHEGNGVDSGAAYVFRFDGTDWNEEAELLADDGQTDDWFGFSVAISGDVGIVGAPYHDENGVNSGSSYIYRFYPDRQEWVQEDEVLASDGNSSEFFGAPVSIDNDLAIVGSGDGWNTQAAYVYRFDGAVWKEEWKLVTFYGGIAFGASVGISGEVVVVGAPGLPMDGSSGSAFVFALVDLDCNGNEIPDECDIAEGTSPDCNGNGIPDECEADVPCPCEGDANGDDLVDPLDAGFVLARFGCPVGTGDPDCDIADMNGDGLVDPLDSGFVLARFGPCE